MVVNYCPNCFGHPYTDNLDLTLCPICGHPLSSEWVSEFDLAGRVTLPSTGNQSFGGVGNPGQFENGSAFGLPNTVPADSSAQFWAENNNDPWASDDPFDQTASEGPEAWGFGLPDKQPEYVNPVALTPSEKRTTSVPKKNAAASSMGHVSKVPVNDVMAGNVVRGRIANYSNSEAEAGIYRRLFIQRLYDAVVYGQRFEDLIHRFTVRVGSDDPLNGRYVDVPVNVHGTIAGGMQLLDNLEVEVTGRYKNNVLMARHVDIINGGARTAVQFQHSVRGIVAGLASLVLLTLIAYGVLALGGLAKGGAILGNLGSFIVTWLLISGAVAAVWIFLLSRMGTVAQILFLRNGRVPIIGILALGLLLSLAAVNAFGLGNTAGNLVDSVSALLYQLAVPLIMVFGIALMVSSIFK